MLEDHDPFFLIANRVMRKIRSHGKLDEKELESGTRSMLDGEIHGIVNSLISRLSEWLGKTHGCPAIANRSELFLFFSIVDLHAVAVNPDAATMIANDLRSDLPPQISPG